MNIRKKILFSAITILLSIVMIELLMFFLLLSSIIKTPTSSILVKKFPAQIRMNYDEISKEFPTVSPIPTAGQFLGFDFDSAMGYRQLDALEWYGDSNNIENKTVVVTFGGSTTVKDNWPKYLRKYAEVENVKEDIVVLNAGLWGYMTFNEKIYFTSWILPMLEDKGIKPDIVLTMDGANDIWYRILAYTASKNEQQTIWNPQYHAYHQQHDIDMKKIRTVNGIMLQLLSNFAKIIYSTSIRILPYTLKVIEGFIRSSVENPIKYTTSDRAAPLVKKLPKDVENKIVGAFEYTLTDFLGSASIRDIQFVAYLQPVVLAKYYPYSMTKNHFYQGINYMGISLSRTNSMFTPLYCDYVVQTDEMYHQSDILYKRLNEQYPGHFKSMIDIFKDINKPEELFSKDAIHYNSLGKEIIAHAVIKDLIAKKILTVYSQR